MADFNVNHISSKQGQQGPVMAGITTVSSIGAMRFPSGPTDHRGGRGRGITGGGFVSPSSQNVMDYIEISTTGNALDFGDLTSILRNIATCASSTRGVCAGGYHPAPLAQMLYTIMSSQGGVSEFGNLTVARQYTSALSNGHGGL